ncbi:MAG TPA: hypothetical protein VGB42_05535 [Candidatus Thermoplasmatota archaeon]
MGGQGSIAAAKRVVSSEWLGREGVVGVGVEADGAGREFIAVMVREEVPGLLQRIAEAARGFPVHLIVSGKIRAR